MKQQRKMRIMEGEVVHRQVMVVVKMNKNWLRSKLLIMSSKLKSSGERKPYWLKLIYLRRKKRGISYLSIIHTKGMCRI